jgi:asparagine synthase (glutamine-hydrolysing)
MSGIVGILYINSRPLDHEILDRMLESIVHRGPDGTGAWAEGPVGLGHQMFRTTPESLKENLPLVDENGDFVLTADARIDNREELIKVLDFPGLPRKELTDSELILGAYKKWGEHCPKRLLGDFAFAIWDRRKQKLFCARDHMGLKPFYYHRSDRVFVFASEIKALLRVQEVPRRLNEVAVADHLALNVQDKEITFYRDIFRLPPAHSMTVGREGTMVREYWALDPTRELRLSSNEEYAEAFREIFTEAVRCRLRSVFPVGSDLSGGLDSSSVTCVARKLLVEERGTKLHTFSSIPEHVAESDESPYIDAVLALGGFKAHKLADERMSPLSNLENILRHTDQPPFGGMAFDWGIRDAAYREGVRVVLTGVDGDTVVDESATRLLDLARGVRWITLANEIDALSRTSGWSRRRLLRNFVVRPLLPGRAQQTWQLLRSLGKPKEPVHPLIRPKFAREVGLQERIQGRELGSHKHLQLSRENHWLNLVYGLWPRSFEEHNAINAAFPVESYHPLFDRRMVEFCLALPSEQKLDRGYGRVVLRRALTDVVPEKVGWRFSKGNYTHATNYGLLMYDRRTLQEALTRDLHLIDKYVDTTELLRTYHRWLVGTSPNSGPLITAVILISWLRRGGVEH